MVLMIFFVFCLSRIRCTKIQQPMMGPLCNCLLVHRTRECLNKLVSLLSTDDHTSRSCHFLQNIQALHLKLEFSARFQVCSSSLFSLCFNEKSSCFALSSLGFCLGSCLLGLRILICLNLGSLRLSLSTKNNLRSLLFSLQFGVVEFGLRFVLACGCILFSFNDGQLLLSLCLNFLLLLLDQCTFLARNLVLSQSIILSLERLHGQISLIIEYFELELM
mmetsp:Transcript_10973/g.40870  ORF Transcript_10973/g.40870 Transcript_10973/m.40870 type:complete len:219 (+) Transcript_10973:1793-2449(+)